MAFRDVKAIRLAADLASKHAKLDMLRVLEKAHDQNILMDEIDKLEDVYRSKFSSVLVRQSLLIWIFAVHRAQRQSLDPSVSRIAKVHKAKPASRTINTARDHRKTRSAATFPLEAVEKIVCFVGDARVINPMTAALAGALSSAADRWKQLVADVHVGRVLQEVSRWWGTNGGSLVVAALDAHPGNCFCSFSIPAGFGEPLWRHFQKETLLNSSTLEGYHAETHILQRVASFFSGSPYNYKVTCSEIPAARSLPRDIYRHLQAWKRNNEWYESEEDILSVPNGVASFMFDNEVIEWTLEWSK
eukprot:TRINITY_DN3634_c0_g1_i2.p1 TRINITY_DN3634_c0_g1~~TRINITY_DN3634_c0_g1_i2.p1  ORF type:complete len:321 (-),score=51.74 TRINITY_DN3634_c0_g1_i2:165-1070(-)